MELNALQDSAERNRKLYSFDEPKEEILEKFATPTGPGDMTLHIEVEEFTSLCPKTGQPDFAKLVLDYKPRDYCVESKSLKLYLMGYRNHGAFHEDCVRRISEDLIRLLDPEWLCLRGEFTPRGGIPFWPTVNYIRPGGPESKYDFPSTPPPIRPHTRLS